MRKIEELRSAAKELVETLGLVDENKDDIVINNKMKAPELEAIIKDAVNEPGLITPDDEFTKETLEVIEEYSTLRLVVQRRRRVEDGDHSSPVRVEEPAPKR